MAAPDELVAVQLALGPDSPHAEVLAAVDAVLGADVPWVSRLAAVSGIVWRALTGPVGVGIYASDPPGVRIVLAASQGAPAAMWFGWGKDIAGSAAAERVVQFVPGVRAFPGHRMTDRSVAASVAVPITLRRVVLGVVEARIASADHLGLVEAELVQGVATRLATAWPAAWATGLPGADPTTPNTREEQS
jgi:putative methionine-R-sulfoxide reductase with GAF domain